MIYFDHNATTPTDDAVLEAMQPFLTTFYANPSSLYRAGRMVRSAVETAREQVAALVSVQPSQIIFTSGGTEANNLALKGTKINNSSPRFAVSAVEHPSVLEPASWMKRHGGSSEIIGVDKDGRIRPEDFEKVCNDSVDLISVMLANNETGAIHDISMFSAAAQEHNIIFHTDAVQAVGKIPVDFNRLGVDSMTLSSHKIYGPKGAGALVVDKRLDLTPIISGGGQENGFRAGTENVAAIVGFGKSAELAKSQLERRSVQLQELKKRLEAGLEKVRGLVIFSKAVCRLPNTVQFGIPGIDGEMLLMQLDRKGVAVSSGSACSSGGEASHVLMAMGFEESLAKSAIRVSLGQSNTISEVNKFVEILNSIVSVPS